MGESEEHGRGLRRRRDRLAAAAAAAGITPDRDEPGRDWADRLQATPPGHVTLNTKAGPVTRPVGSLTPGQVAPIQLTPPAYGDEITPSISLGPAPPVKAGPPGQ